MYQHILVPTDGSPLSASAVEKAVSLAKTVGAKVTVLAAVEQLPVLAWGGARVYPHAEEFWRQLNADAERSLADLLGTRRRPRGRHGRGDTAAVDGVAAMLQLPARRLCPLG